MQIVAEMYDAQGNKIGGSRDLKVKGFFSKLSIAAALIGMCEQAWRAGGWVKIFKRN